MQPQREVSANKSKKMKGNESKFPFISFSESGLFKGLQRIQIKKFASGLTRVSGCAQIAPPLLSSPAASPALHP
jgi:hypothetical protein